MLGSQIMTLRAVAHGYVQGVGFRVFVRSAGWRLGLQGYVRNRSDGCVEVVARGPRRSLEALLAEIRRGPAGADVAWVEEDWAASEPSELGPRFEVRH